MRSEIADLDVLLLEIGAASVHIEVEVGTDWLAVPTMVMFFRSMINLTSREFGE
jgi:hypothetical protein